MVERKQTALLRILQEELETMLPPVQRVIRQANARVLGGDVHVPAELVSVFEPSTEVIRKGKASKPTEFGKMVKIQEAANQIVTDYEWRTGSEGRISALKRRHGLNHCRYPGDAGM